MAHKKKASNEELAYMALCDAVSADFILENVIDQLEQLFGEDCPLVGTLHDAQEKLYLATEIHYSIGGGQGIDYNDYKNWLKEDNE